MVQSQRQSLRSSVRRARVAVGRSAVERRNGSDSSPSKRRTRVGAVVGWSAQGHWRCARSTRAWHDRTCPWPSRTASTCTPLRACMAATERNSSGCAGTRQTPNRRTAPDAHRRWAPLLRDQTRLERRHAVLLSPFDLCARVCALIPRPGFNMVSCYSCVSSHSAPRSQVVPTPLPAVANPLLEEEDGRRLGLQFGEGDDDDGETASPTRRR